MTLDIHRLRIAMLSAHSSPLGKLGSKDTGGMSVYVRELSRELGRRGHLVDIYTRHNQNTHDSVIELHKNVRLIHLRLGENQYLSKTEMVPHLQDFFRDVMVMPSYYESFGLVSIEALACGIPVVATPVGVMDTIIKEGLNGQLVANGDAKLLAGAIDKVTSLYPALSAEAIRQTVQVFGWPNIASAIIKEYEKTLALSSPD